jgi:histone H3/H4
MAELQAAGVSRIIRKAGAERVSAEATDQFREYLETYGKERGQKNS